MATFSTDLPQRPAVPGACAVALAYLDDARAAAARLADASDKTALHEFRVAIRRLRVTVRAYPALHERVPRKQRRGLRKLARATNAARDAEVQIAWFNERSGRFSADQRAALARVRARLRARRRAEFARTRAELGRSFGKLARRLRRRLTALESDAGPREARFGAVAAATLVHYAGELDLHLVDVALATQPDQMHAARIAAKRVRYLLEPLEPSLAGARPVVKRLKRLQDLFGALTDAHELDVVLEKEGASVAAVADVLHTEAAEALSLLRREWAETGGGPMLQRELATLTRRLRPGAAAPRSFRQPARRRRRPVSA
jgi:CHAD domain-containing protein